MVSDGEEGKDRGSTLTGALNEAWAGMKIKLKNGGDEEAAWWKSEAQTVGVVMSVRRLPPIRNPAENDVGCRQMC